MTADDQMLLRHRWTDGTTHLAFDPLEWLERLAVITPRPRINVILYHGGLAPRTGWRRQQVQAQDVRAAEGQGARGASREGIAHSAAVQGSLELRNTIGKWCAGPLRERIETGGREAAE